MVSVGRHPNIELLTYSEVESDVNTRRYFGQAKLQHYFSDPFFAFGLTALEHDPEPDSAVRGCRELEINE